MTKPKDAEDRRQQRLRRLGTQKPRCVICGESDAAVMERHHIAGRNHDDAEVDICANCHRKETDKQRDHVFAGPAAPECPSAKVGHYLVGLGNLMCAIGPTLQQFGLKLIQESHEDE